MTLEPEQLERITEAWRRAGEAIRNFGSATVAAADALQVTIDEFQHYTTAKEVSE